MGTKSSSSLHDEICDEHWFEGEEALGKLYKALSGLTKKQRLVFDMRYFQEFSYEDIALIARMPVDKLKALYAYVVKEIEVTINRY